jgi:hypothetical protein
MSLFSRLFGKKPEPPREPRLRDDPFYAEIHRKKTVKFPTGKLDVFASNGRLYCSRTCAMQAGFEPVTNICRRDYVQMSKGFAPPGPKCCCGEMFNSWR